MSEWRRPAPRASATTLPYKLKAGFQTRHLIACSSFEKIKFLAL